MFMNKLQVTNIKEPYSSFVLHMLLLLQCNTGIIIVVFVCDIILKLLLQNIYNLMVLVSKRLSITVSTLFLGCPS